MQKVFSVIVASFCRSHSKFSFNVCVSCRTTESSGFLQRNAKTFQLCKLHISQLLMHETVRIHVQGVGCFHTYVGTADWFP